MTLATFVTLVSVVIGFVAALFFCFGALMLTRKEIGELSGTSWNENASLAKFLLSTKAEYFCGGVALAAAFVLQFLSSIPGLVSERLLSSSAAVGAILALAVGGLVGALLLWVRSRLRAQLTAGP